ncbi:cholesterol 24-hydroxylase-like [Ranitomeya variabilis]|uniref:cholesterol 24-hydroxylase-like n=1 Tax=Ranitomeya variabilis TaxID=490064 RepID=UPI004055BF5B
MALWSLISGALLLLLGLAVVFFLLYCAYIQYIHMKYDHIPGPPRDSFLLGSLPTLMRSMKDDSLVHELFLRWAQRYGAVVRINALHNVMILLTSPNGVKEILMSPKYTKDNTYRRAFSLFGVRFLGSGLLTDCDYDHWHKQRRIMDPAFSRTYLMGLMGTFNEEAEELMERLSEKADGKCEISIHEVMSKVTLDVIAKYTPGRRAFIRDVRESVRLLRQTGKNCIERRRKAIQDGDDIPADILSQILTGAATEDSYNLESLLDNFVTFFIAGQETTANQLAFAVMELAQYPDVLKRVRGEIDDVFGSHRDITYDDLHKLQYLSQVLKETLRLYPTAPGTSRLLDKELVIEGLRIPPNVSLVFNSYVYGRMEQHFQDPLSFDPDRFAPESERPHFTYFPFSLGPRSCTGQVFSQMEAKVVMAKLLQRFEFQLTDGQSFDMVDSGTLRPKDGVMCRVRPQSTKN